jgi:hypothetical protein
MNQDMLIWVVLGAAALIVFPLLAIEFHQRYERRIHRKRGLRKTDKIRLSKDGEKATS